LVGERINLIESFPEARRSAIAALSSEEALSTTRTSVSTSPLPSNSAVRQPSSAPAPL
jgi:hypothetical protein